MSSPRQRGVALLSVLLVVVLATLLVTRTVGHTELLIRRNANLTAAEQAFQLSMGLEAWANVILEEDRKEGGSLDSRNDSWAFPLPVIPVDGGQLSGRLEDLDGRLNLNALANPNAGLRQIQHQRVARLLELLELDPLLVNRIEDWADRDPDPEPDGAEDYHYLGLDPAYRVANGIFKHISELRLIEGVDDAVYQALLPHVSALPSALVAVNVNTASEAVLYALDERIDVSKARSVYKKGRAKYTNEQEFFLQLGLTTDQPPVALISFNSEYFLARGMCNTITENIVSTRCWSARPTVPALSNAVLGVINEPSADAQKAPRQRQLELARSRRHRAQRAR